MAIGWERWALTAVGLCASGAAMAQSTPPPSAGVPQDLGRGQLEQNLPDKTPAQAPRVSVDSRQALPQTPCALDQSSLRINLQRLALTRSDGSALPPELVRLLAGVDADLHGDHPIAVVCTIRDRINERLDGAGYVALAQVPAQKIDDGTLHMEIVTARIVAPVRIVGDAGHYAPQLERAIARIRALDPLNRREAERILLLMRDIPGLDVNLSLSAASGADTRPGDVIGTMTVATRRFAVLANMQNFGSRALGRWIGSVRVEAYGLTGLSDRTYVGYSNSTDWNEVRVAQVGHDFALTDSGLRLGLRGSFAWSRPTIPSLDLRSRSIIAGLDLTYPLLRSLRNNVVGGIGFEAIEQQSHIRSGSVNVPFTLDRTRVFYARLDASSQFGGATRNLFQLRNVAEVRKGLNVFNPTRLGVATADGAPSRFYGDPQAVVLKDELNVLVKPRGPAELNLAAFGQWSSDPLLNLEEFSLGNFTHGRGYDPGSNGGDHVYGFTAEPRVQLPVPGVNVAASAFYDWVRIINTDPGTVNARRTLRSVGGGLRFILQRRLVLDVTYAHPLDKAQINDVAKPADRVLVSLTAKIF